MNPITLSSIAADPTAADVVREFAIHLLKMDPCDAAGYCAVLAKVTAERERAALGLPLTAAHGQVVAA